MIFVNCRQGAQHRALPGRHTRGDDHLPRPEGRVGKGKHALQVPALAAYQLLVAANLAGPLTKRQARNEGGYLRGERVLQRI